MARTYEDFVDYLNKEIIPELVPLRKHYFGKIDFKNRTAFQTAKFIEEVGEFAQAFYERNSCGWDIVYPEIRGTLESEAADVILSGCLLAVVWNHSIQVVPKREVLLDDEDYFVSTLFEDAARARISVVIRNIYSLLHKRCDIARHVKVRLAFNKYGIQQEYKEREERDNCVTD